MAVHAQLPLILNVNRHNAEKCYIRMILTNIGNSSNYALNNIESAHNITI